MLLTETPVRKVRASGEGTWSIWLSWHWLTSVPGIKKAPGDRSLEAVALYAVFDTISIPRIKAKILHDITHYPFPNSRTVR